MANGRSGTKISLCSFCEKPQSQSDMVISGEGKAAVCYDCILVIGQVVEDENPSPKDVGDYRQALKQAGVEHIFHRYDGTGHAFQSFNSKERYRHQASEDAWEKVLAFFEEELK